jgi:diguanylate cyclase (GGDEF)-like protein
VHARIIASDAISRMGDPEGAKAWQLQLFEQATAWPPLDRHAAVNLATTCWRLGERAESMHWISRANTDWPQDVRPDWRAEGLMVFALLSMSRSQVDYTLARHAITAIETHCSPLRLSVTLANFAELAAECGDLAIATDFADNALSTLSEHPEVAVPLTLDSIARALLAVGETAAAIELLEAALVLEEQIGCTDVHGDPWLTLAEAFLADGRLDDALGMLDAPRRAAWAAKSAWTSSRDHKQRATILAGLHRWEEAYAELEAHVEAYESLRSVEGDRIIVESETRQVVSEERRRAERFEQLALTDPLTGLPNRRQVDDWLAQPHSRLHLAIVDLDHFKRVNDNYSHAAGDLVLQRIGHELQAAASDPGAGSARVGRLGGEEFIVVWVDTIQDAVLAHAHRLLDCLRAIRFPDVDPDLVMTASIGLALHRADVTGPSLLAEADRSLYVAKRTGRDRVSCTGPEGTALR